MAKTKLFEAWSFRLQQPAPFDDPKYAGSKSMGFSQYNTSSTAQKSTLHTTTYSDEIEIEVALEKYTGVKLFLSYTMRNSNTGETVAVASSAHCFIDENGRPIAVKKRVPEFDAVLKETAHK